MQIEATLWDGDSWATDGGKTKINWNYAPFKAHFQGFDITGCQVENHNTSLCGSHKYWWNGQKFWQLDPTGQKAYENVKHKYVNYDYCADRQRYPTPPLECQYN